MPFAAGLVGEAYAIRITAAGRAVCQQRVSTNGQIETGEERQ